MKDINLAKKLLVEEDNTLVVVKSGKVLFKSKDRGIKPMYILSRELKNQVGGASIADKVIGKGAALLSQYLNVYEVYGELISKSAIDLFESHGIKYSFDTICDNIKNRDKTGLCPIESLSADVTDAKEFIIKLEDFLKIK